MKSQEKVTKTSLSLLLFVALMLAIAPALQAVEPVRQFSATISPTSVNAGATDSYTIVITCLGVGSGNSANLASAKVAVPSGFTVVPALTVAATGSKTWTGSLVSGEIQLTATGAASNHLTYGQSVSVSFSASAPTPSSTTVYTWNASAWNDKNYTGAAFDPPDPQPAVTVIASSYIFAGWRPPVQLPGPAEGPVAWNSGRTLPVKFLVVDGNGDPVTSGVVANVQIGSSAVVAAALDDATMGQWKAEILVVGSGTQAVTITGNVTGVTALSIEVVENP